MILPETGLDGCVTKAERLRQTVAEYKFERRDEQPGGVSIGAACYPDHGQDKQSLIASADQMLYRAKHAGRNRVCSPAA